jgi:hypothetical protein
MSESPLLRLRRHFTNPLPLLEHLVLRTESHASCAGLAFFALVGFYPFCLLLLWVSGDVLQWTAGETVIRETLREYYPEGQAFLVRNLEAFADVNVEPEMAIVCVVGENLRSDTSLFALAVTALEEIQLRLVSQAASRRNITFVLRDADVEAAMNQLHEALFPQDVVRSATL